MLNNFDNTNCNFFEIKGIYECRILDIIDGDTIIGCIIVDNKAYKFRMRLKNKYASELKEENGITEWKEYVKELIHIEINENEDKKEIRKKIKEYLNINCIIKTIECFGNDKYGRILVKIN